jgi:hypothetical protein
MKSLRHEDLRRDSLGVVHILDDTLNDGFAWCGKAPLDLYNSVVYSAATCLFCIVKAAKYRGLE